MDNKRKTLLFAALAAVAAASTAPMAAASTRPIALVLPLVAMGILLFFAGLYAGLARATR